LFPYWLIYLVGASSIERQHMRDVMEFAVGAVMFLAMLVVLAVASRRGNLLRRETRG
jgi:hypothetical protein